MTSLRRLFLGVALALLLSLPTLQACTTTPDLGALNAQLHGTVIEHTDHYGADHRFWSNALGRPRNLYVYVPPGFDPARRYPLMVWLHGVAQDERDIVVEVTKSFDQVMASGQCPPCIIAIPDGSVDESDRFYHPGSFFINSDAGRFEDYIVDDLWAFLHCHYPIRPEREAHLLGGVSMGSMAAFGLPFKHPDRFGLIAGLLPVLNSRWVNCRGRYRSNFDPACWGWREHVSRHEVIARFGVVLPVRMKWLVDPLFHPDRTEAEIIAKFSEENPTELLDRANVQPGQFQMYVGYGGRDEFNLDAQVESFLYIAQCQRHLDVRVAYLPQGRHNRPTVRELFPSLVEWLAPLLWPYAPGPLGISGAPGTVCPPSR